MSPKWFIFSKAFNSEFLCIKVWFIDHNFWKIFIELLTSLATASKSTKYVSLDNQKYMTHSTLINLHPNEYSQNCAAIH